MKAAAFSLVVLTLNVAGPRRVQQAWETRRDAIVSRLKAEASDAAAFQEVWRPGDLDALQLAAGHAHAAAAPELGLAVTSRLPIVSTDSRDLGGGWGVLRARLRSGRGEFDVYTTRLEPSDGPASPSKLGRLFRLAEFVRAQSSTHPFVLLGDLGVSSDENAPTLLLDLLEARDLCVSHGDEVCGRTLGGQRVDYALIPYSPRTPREYARTAFTDLAAGDEDAAPAHFGLRARLDERFPTLRPAAQPAGRDEALNAIDDALEGAIRDAEARIADPGWVPLLAAWREAAAQREAARLSELEEEVRSARVRGTKRRAPVARE